MEPLPSIAWVYWDPKPYVFIIPYINHPLTWYGLLFVAGFIAGFFILLPLVKNKLQLSQTILSRDIENWPSLTLQLYEAFSSAEHPLQSIVRKLDKTTRQKLSETKGKEPLDPEEKSRILQALSQSLHDRDQKIDRETLEKLLPKGIRTISDLSFAFVDRLVWFIIIGTLVGARLGHVFFYDWPRYQHHLIDIFKTWEGGLASHGGTLGVLISVYLYQQWVKKSYPEITFLGLCDLLTMPTAIAAVFIRLGNFVNQEILGTPTQAPWGVIFGHPAGGELALPRHPAQLYEAAAYLTVFFVLRQIWKLRGGKLPEGFLLGIFFTLAFGLRMIIECLKTQQSAMIDESLITTGQYLSIPFVMLGVVLMLAGKKNWAKSR